MRAKERGEVKRLSLGWGCQFRIRPRKKEKLEIKIPFYYVRTYIASFSTYSTQNRQHGLRAELTRLVAGQEGIGIFRERHLQDNDRSRLGY